MNQATDRQSGADEQPFQSNDRLSSQFSEAISSARGRQHSDLITELANVQTRHHGHNPSLVKETTNLFKPAGTNLPACRSLMPPSIYKSNMLYEEKQAPVPEEEVLPPPVRKHQKKLAGKSAIHQAAFPEYQLY